MFWKQQRASAAEPSTPHAFPARAARFCFWSPFVAFLSLLPLVDLDERGADFRVLRGIIFAVFIGLAAAGFAAGCVAWAKLRWNNAKDSLLRSAFGLAVDGWLLGAITIGAIGMLRDARRAPPSMTPEARAKRAVRDLRMLESHLERAAAAKTNRLYDVGVAGTNFLSGVLQIVTNLYAASQPLQGGGLLNMSNVSGRDDLAKRRELIANFLTANEAASNYFSSLEKNADKMLVEAKLSPLETTEQSNRFHAQMTRLNFPLAFRENARWAGYEEEALGLLESNWFSWKYDPIQKKTILRDEAVRAKFNDLVHAINQNYSERIALQKQTQQVLSNGLADNCPLLFS